MNMIVKANKDKFKEGDVLMCEALEELFMEIMPDRVQKLMDEAQKARDEETASWIYPQYVIPILLATLSGNYAVRFHQAILEKFLPGLAFRVTGLWSKRNRTLSRRRRHEFI